MLSPKTGKGSCPIYHIWKRAQAVKRDRMFVNWKSIFAEEEVYSALESFSGDKALGSDGFTMAFWQFSWDFV